MNLLSWKFRLFGVYILLKSYFKGLPKQIYTKPITIKLQTGKLEIRPLWLYIEGEGMHIPI